MVGPHKPGSRGDHDRNDDKAEQNEAKQEFLAYAEAEKAQVITEVYEIPFDDGDQYCSQEIFHVPEYAEPLYE